MYVLGSFDCNECEVLDTTTHNASFQPLATRPLEQDNPAVCVVNTDVYLLGSNYYDSNKKKVQKYSTSTNTWTVLPDLQHQMNGEFPCFIRENTIRIYTEEGEFQETYTLGHA